MRYKDWACRIGMIGIFCFMVGTIVTTIGDKTEAKIFTGWDAINISLFLFSLLWIGFMAGMEHEKNKLGREL